MKGMIDYLSRLNENPMQGAYIGNNKKKIGFDRRSRITITAN